MTEPSTVKKKITPPALCSNRWEWGNHVTGHLFRVLDIDFSRDLFDEGFDADQNGSVDLFDMAQISHNVGAGSITAALTSVDELPDLSLALDNDTGVDDTDAITTDPTLSGSLGDGTDVSSILLVVDGGSEVDIVDIIDIDTTGNFLITPDDFEEALGDPLAEGPHTVELTVIDNAGEEISAEVDFTLIVDNQAPAVDAIDDQTATEDQSFFLDFADRISDSDTDDQVTVTVEQTDGTDLPSWLSLDAEARTLTGTPDNDDVGEISLDVIAIDSQGAETSRSFTLTVENSNDPPELVAPIDDQTTNEDELFTLDVSDSFTDIDPRSTHILGPAVERFFLAWLA